MEDQVSSSPFLPQLWEQERAGRSDLCSSQVLGNSCLLLPGPPVGGALQGPASEAPRGGAARGWHSVSVPNIGLAQSCGTAGGWGLVNHLLPQRFPLLLLLVFLLCLCLLHRCHPGSLSQDSALTSALSAAPAGAAVQPARES